MSVPRIIPPDVSRVQVEAADPDTSADVSGSAASTCTRLTSGGMMRGTLIRRPPRRRRPTATIP